MHLASQTTTLAGYTIPKGTMLVPLQWAIHLDPASWDDPSEFRPERFLGEDGALLKPQGFIPFQTGKLKRKYHPNRGLEKYLC